jgi:hypothetical protein
VIIIVFNNISFSQYIVGKLRQNIQDYNDINRNGNEWIYPDHPQIQLLMKNKNNFPRISVETLNQPTTEDIGMGSSDQVQTASLKIIAWSIRDLVCTINTEIDESHTYNTSTNIYELNSLPFSDITFITGIKGSLPYTFIKNIDYQIKDNDGDGFRDSVEWIADTPDNSTNFLINYKRNATGLELCRIISQNINTYLRNNWREWEDRKFWGYKLINSTPIDFDENIGVSRYEMTIQMEGINIGDEI